MYSPNRYFLRSSPKSSVKRASPVGCPYTFPVLRIIKTGKSILSLGF